MGKHIILFGLTAGLSADISTKLTRSRITEQLVDELGLGRLSSSNRIHNGPLAKNTFQNFNLTFLESDPDFREFRRDFIREQMPKPVLKSSSYKTEQEKKASASLRTSTMSKFITVKLMIMFFQSSPEFGKFNHYGCWCFPDGTNDLSAYNSGYGDPVDEIDKTCKRMSQCYKCAQMKYGKHVCPMNTPYNYQGLEDDVTGQRYIKCLDPEDTCARSLCECDRKMAQGIGNLEDEWEEAYHSKWGNFDRRQTCRVSSAGAFGWRVRSVAGHRDGGGGGGGAPDACCGDEGEKFPYNTDGGRRSCCYGRTYNTESMKCCPQDGIKSLDAKCL